LWRYFKSSPWKEDNKTWEKIGGKIIRQKDWFKSWKKLVVEKKTWQWNLTK
jgi:hypothetical protein